MTAHHDWAAEASNIAEMGRSGKTGRELAAFYGISPARMYQVIRELGLFASKAEWGRGRRSRKAKELGKAAMKKLFMDRVRVLKLKYPELHEMNVQPNRECPITGLLIDYRASRYDWLSLRFYVKRSYTVDEVTTATAMTRLGYHILHELPQELLTPAVWDKIGFRICARDPNRGLKPEDMQAIAELRARPYDAVEGELPKSLANSAYFNAIEAE